MPNFVGEAINGLKAELRAVRGTRQKLSILFPALGQLSVNILSGVAFIPYGIRAQKLYKNLPKWEPSEPHQPQQVSKVSSPPNKSPYGVALLRDQKYGPGERHVLDVYVPERLKTKDAESALRSGAPVVFFTHGGVWASGEPWQTVCMATRLAQAGCVVVCHTYTLFPEALVPQMIQEVSAAMTWTMDNAHMFGGSADRVTAIGHSAGAHLLAMALMKRAGLPFGPSEIVVTHGLPSDPHASKGNQTLPPFTDVFHPDIQNDTRMPTSFVGMAGVYNIDAHYEHERFRGVHFLSMMSRAMGGFEGHAALSPAVVFRSIASTLRQDQQQQSVQQNSRPYETFPSGAVQQEAGEQLQLESPEGGFDDESVARNGRSVTVQRTSAAVQTRSVTTASSSSLDGGDEPYVPRQMYASFPLLGDTIPWRMGLDLNGSQGLSTTGNALMSTPPSLLSTATALVATANHEPTSLSQQQQRGDHSMATPVYGDGPAGAAEALLQGLDRLPPMYYMAGCADYVVPWHESAEMVAALRSCGVQSRLLVYQHAEHPSFILDWYPAPSIVAERELVQSTQGAPFRDENISIAVNTYSSSSATSNRAPQMEIDPHTRRPRESVGGVQDWGRDILDIITQRFQMPLSMPSLGNSSLSSESDDVENAVVYETVQVARSRM